MKLPLPSGQLKKQVVDDVDMSDLTASKRTGDAYWDPDNVLVIPFDKEPTAAEQEAIKQRLTSDGSVEEQLQRLGMAAMTSDRKFRDTTAKQITDAATAIINDPANNKTNIQQLAQSVRALANQQRDAAAARVVLFRLVLRLMDATD